MLPTRGYAAPNPTGALEPFSFNRRSPGDKDILIEILFCGVCHSDIHQVRNEWGNSLYPMVPGHEIVGKVTKVGKSVTQFKPGDIAGVGCFVDSCGKCRQCQRGVEQCCEVHTAFTYNNTEMDEQTPTHGGYSGQIVVKENYALHISPDLPLDRVAPLMCAGITTYSPLHRWKIGKGNSVAILGLGGLGHMGVKLAAAFGAEVTVLSTSKSKEADAKRLGAHEFINTTDSEAMKRAAGKFDFILDTVSADHDLNAYLNLLRTDGAMVLVGLPEKPALLHAGVLVGERRTLAGSSIGGIKETQEMLDFCADKNVLADVEVIAMNQINQAYERMIKNDVRYRFVIDINTL